MNGYEKTFILNAEDNLNYLIEKGLDGPVLKKMWDSLNEYANICEREYNSYISNISPETMTILYTTYVIEKRKPCNGTYFILNNKNNRIKIGTSSYPLNRLDQLKKQYSFMNANEDDLYLIGVIYTPMKEYQIEKHYHEFFSGYREKGEWFNIPPQEIEEIFQENILQNLSIKVKYDHGLLLNDGFETVGYEDIDRKNLMQFAIEDMCKRRFIIESLTSNIELFEKVNKSLNDYHGNHILLFDKQRPKSFELFEWLKEDDLLDSARMEI